MKVAAVVHLFHQAMWPELAAYLRNIPQDFALFVSVPNGTDAAPVLADFPKAHISYVRNVGRDVAPFIALLPALQEFDAVCKIHSKSEAGWRLRMLDDLLGTPELVTDIIRAFEMRALALLGPWAFWLNGHTHIDRNGPQLQEWLGHTMPPSHSFFAGTMFWLRPSAYMSMTNLPGLKFKIHRSTDGYVEHAIERLFGIVPALQGKMVGLSNKDGRPRVRIIPASWPGRRDFGEYVLTWREKRA